MLSLLAQMKVYKNDILYCQGDPSEEIFFIIKGRVKFYYKRPEPTTKQMELKAKGKIKSKVELTPINLQVEGSYFGDNDVLLNEGRDGRDSTAIAETECQLLLITKQQILDLLKKFPLVRKEMKIVATTRYYHNRK